MNLYYHPGRYQSLTRREWRDEVQVSSTWKEVTRKRRYGAGSRFSKSFAFWKSTVGITGNYSQSHDYQLSSGERVGYQINSGSVAFSLAGQPVRYFNLEGESSFLYSRLKNRTFSALSSDGLRGFRHLVSLNCFPVRSVVVRWNQEFYHSNNRSVSFNYFSDLSCSWKPGKWELEICGNNLWGNSKYERRYVGALQETFRNGKW